MKTIKFTWMALCVLIALTGCAGGSNTVETCVLSHEQYSDKAALESATQPESLTARQDIYANIYFIESPLGMEYTVKWTANGTEIKTETKAMETDRQGLIIFPLEAENAQTGTMLCAISHGDDILLSKEILIK